MRGNGFAKTLAAGVVAAATFPITALALAPVVHWDTLVAAHWLGAAVLYTVMLSDGARRRVAVAGATLAAGGLVLALAGSLAQVALGLTVVVAVARSGFSYRARPARAVALELGLACGALAVARFIAGPHLLTEPLTQALALWGWFLVQSFFFLVGGVERRRRRTRGDPFDAARARLVELLDAR